MFKSKVFEVDRSFDVSELYLKLIKLKDDSELISHALNHVLMWFVVGFVLVFGWKFTRWFLCKFSGAIMMMMEMTVIGAIAVILLSFVTWTQYGEQARAMLSTGESFVSAYAASVPSIPNLFAYLLRK